MTDPLPNVAAVRPAARTSRVSCGHRVNQGAIIVCRAGRWTCFQCALQAIRAITPDVPATRRGSTTNRRRTP